MFFLFLLFVFAVQYDVINSLWLTSAFISFTEMHMRKHMEKIKFYYQPHFI
jgi:hypothetical protein